MRLSQYILLIFTSLLILAGCQKSDGQLTDAEKLEKFFSKDDVIILVTDSGLGGLSVAADVTKRMEGSGVFRTVDVTYFNAQPHAKSGYNSMKTTEQKVAVFENALNAIEKNFKPDLILIACNTLSVIYEYTEFSKKTNIPVVGIVGTGVDLIHSKIAKDENARVFLFATKTTVKQDKHRIKLAEMGIAKDRIITQACPKLAGRIERGSHSDTTIALVNKYVKELTADLPESDQPAYVSYNCTHYGYVDDIFQDAFKKAGVEVKEFLDPNPLMADFIFDKKYLDRFDKTKVSVRVVSQPELPPGRIASIYDLIEPVSAETAEALFEHEYTPELFAWKSIAEAQ